jgi:hypothetical protein
LNFNLDDFMLTDGPLGGKMASKTWEKDRKKAIAEESLKTRRAREKLKKQLEVLEKKLTSQALEKKTIEIHRWIARHAPHRVTLRSKTISLFDENQNAAKLSRKVAVIAERLRIS